MPIAPLRPCGYSGGCTVRVKNGMCELHKKKTTSDYNRARGSSTKQGYGGEWLKVREKALKRDEYLCQHCLKNDKRYVPAQHVDHVIAFTSNSDPLRLDLDNLQSLCQPCHSRKTATHDGGFGRARKEVADGRTQASSNSDQGITR